MNGLKCLLVVGLICLAGGWCNYTDAEEEQPLRIISLAPSITEILFALGLEENIVGVTTCCNYPAQAQKIEKVATFSGEANLERILLLQPDLILSTGLEQAGLIKKLTSLGIKVVLIYPHTLEELWVKIIEIGKLTRTELQARALVARMRQQLNTLEQKVAAIAQEQRPRVFIEISSDPLMTAGNQSFVGQLIQVAGGNNIATDTARAYSQFSPEVVVQRNPDFIILGYMRADGKTLVGQRLGWQEITAVQQGQIITDINPDLILRPGPRVIQAIEQIQARLYPNLE